MEVTNPIKNRLSIFEEQWSKSNDLKIIDEYKNLNKELEKHKSRLSGLRREKKAMGVDEWGAMFIIWALISAFIAIFIMMAVGYFSNDDSLIFSPYLLYTFLGLISLFFVNLFFSKYGENTDIKEAVKKLKLKQKELEKISIIKDNLEKRCEEERLKFLNNEISDITNQLDQDGNNTLDLAESEDSFMGLLKAQQKKILKYEKEEGKDFTNKFVKLSNFLKLKRAHMQNLFSQLKQIKSLEVLDNAENLIKSDMYMYNLLLLDSLHMISSFVDDDRISFNIIYEKFDSLNVWNTNFQNQMLGKLDLLNDNIERLRGDISEMNHNSNMIINQLQDLSHISENNNRVLDEQLKKINSSIQSNTILNSINTYQNFRTNNKLG